MELPTYIKNAIEDELNNIKISKVSSAREKLTNDYRTKDNRPKRFINSEEEVIAYIASRLPSTYGVFTDILEKINTFTENKNYKSLLDIGSGPGTVMYAIAEYLHDIEKITLLERDKDLIKKGKTISANSDYQSVKNAEWISADIQEIEKINNHDIVTISYVLNELEKSLQEKIIKQLWNKSNDLIIIVEPGTPIGYSNILLAREILITLGGKVLAPCIGKYKCPIKDNDWCHFSKRIERSKYHRLLKDGTESFEDEKFSYLVVSKSEKTQENYSRIVRHPQILKGHTELTLCNEKGLENITISKKDGELYKKAKKAKWGDIL